MTEDDGKRVDPARLATLDETGLLDHTPLEQPRTENSPSRAWL